MSRNPLSEGLGVESCAMRASGLSRDGDSACESGSSARIGIPPHAESSADASSATTKLGPILGAVIANTLIKQPNASRT